jgi:hypothetical protein
LFFFSNILFQGSSEISEKAETPLGFILFHKEQKHYPQKSVVPLYFYSWESKSRLKKNKQRKLLGNVPHPVTSTT